MFDDLNQIPEFLHVAAPIAVGLLAALISVILLLSLIDSARTSSRLRDDRHAARKSWSPAWRRPGMIRWTNRLDRTRGTMSSRRFAYRRWNRRHR